MAKIDMKQLADQIDRDYPPSGVSPYAPPAVRNGETAMRGAVIQHNAEPPLETVKSFGELPAKEIDELEAAIDSEVAALKKEMVEVRAQYMRNIERIRADLLRLRDGVRLGMKTLAELRDQCAKLHEQPVSAADGEQIC